MAMSVRLKSGPVRSGDPAVVDDDPCGIEWRITLELNLDVLLHSDEHDRLQDLLRADFGDSFAALRKRKHPGDVIDTDEAVLLLPFLCGQDRCRRQISLGAQYGPRRGRANLAR